VTPVKTEAKPEPAAGAFAKLVAAGIFLSRISGLIRESLLAAFLGGATMYSDVFRVALRIPNILQNLLGEGTLSASFVPVYAQLLHENKRERAGRVAGGVFILLLVIAGIFGALGVFATPLMVKIFVGGFEGPRKALVIPAMRIIFPMTATLVLYAWALGILNSHRRFFLSYVAPVVWNAVIIAAALWFGHRSSQSHLVLILCWSALIGAFLQLGVLLPGVFKEEPHLNAAWQNTRLDETREVMRNAWPAILGRGVVQIAIYIDIALASFLAVGSPGILTTATTLYVLPVSLFGMSVAASELPDLSRQRLEGEEKLRERVRGGLRQMAVFVVPSVVGYLALGDLIVAAIFQRGKFTATDTFLTYIVLAAFAFGLQASTSTRLLSSTFYALKDTRRPAIFAAIRVAITGGLGFGLMLPFEKYFALRGHPLGMLGLSVAAGIGAWVEWGLLWRTLRKRIGSFGPGMPFMLRLYGAAIVAAVAGRALAFVVPRFSNLMRGGVVVGVFGVLYFLLASAFKIPEATSVVRRVLPRK
jgi:putative peptidoglycan lipid II flippase